MIDLTHKGLPDAIMVDGKPFLINTDFRIWLKVDEILKNPDWTLMDIAFVVKDLTVLDLFQFESQIQEQLLNFYLNPNSTPNVNELSNSDVVVDYKEDGEYIYSAFIQAYGIDLLDADMHWHKFLALFRGLPDSTLLVKIMGYRGYKKPKKGDIYEKYKRIWALPKNQKITTDMQKELEDLFYGSI